jgi:hypothetical protein
MRTALVGALMTTATLAAGSVVLTADDAAVTFAVLRGDGILVPVATRAGDRWSSAWPEPARTIDVPVSVDDLPRRWWGKARPSRTWHAWLVDGARLPAAVKGPAWYPTYCLSGIGLQTNVVGRRPLPPPGTSPYPKMGLAASAPTAFGRIEVLDGQAAVWAPLRARLQAAFAHAARDQRTSGTRTTPRTQVERLYRAPLGSGRFVHYVEAVRRYPDDPAEPASALEAAFAQARCHGMAFASGWFVSDGTTVPEGTAIDVKPVSCRYDGARTMLPLGYLVEGDTTWWFAQLTERNREAYAVIRATVDRPEPRVVVTARGGSCAPAPTPARDTGVSIGTENDWPDRLLEGYVDW